MFKIADEVEIINGIGKGFKGTVEAVEENDLDSVTYTVKLIHADELTRTLVPKLEKDLKLVKASKNKISKTKKEEVEWVKKEPVGAYEQLVEVYNIVRSTLKISELELFGDIVMKDIVDSKMVLEQITQMSIADLMKIKKDINA